jgi:acyl-CoA thioester hydrolase
MTPPDPTDAALQADAATRTDAPAPGGLRTLHESVVAPEEIDHLGHLNVRFYATRALRGTKALLAALGLAPECLETLNAEVFVFDAYTRHYREQLAGAPLAVRGGVLGAAPAGLRCYHELLNTERDELAATFVHRVRLHDRATKEAVDFPEDLVARAAAQAVAWPGHGRPRSLDLSGDPAAPDMNLLIERDLGFGEQRVVREDQCDERGFLKPNNFMGLLWGSGPPTPEQVQEFLVKLDNGHLMGQATMESRACLVELPRAGTRTRSFDAQVEIGRKTALEHNWLMDADSGRLLFRFSMLNLAFDITDRKSIEWPAKARADMEKRYYPELK